MRVVNFEAIVEEGISFLMQPGLSVVGLSSSFNILFE